MVIEEINKFNKITIIILLLIIVTILDVISGNDFSSSLFYLLPIIFAGWYLDRNAGITVSILSAVLWFIAEQINVTTYTNSIIPYWNAIIRLGFFLCIIFLIGMIKNVRESRERERDLIHFIAHDLKSPLGAIITGLEIIREENQQLYKKEKQILDMSIASGNRMMVFINSLVDLGRMEKNKMPVNIKPVNIPLIINEAKEHLSILGEVNGIKIKIKSIDESIYTDENLLLRIIMNLLNNAIKVSNEDSVIEINVEEYEKSKLKFSVTDWGPGIPKGTENRLFRKFYTGKTSIGGSGVGLAFCKNAVEVLGGNIRIESEEDKGTTVIFILPKGEVEEIASGSGESG